MMKVRFHEALHTKRASSIPGDKTLVLSRPAKDSNGREYPKGTKLVPLCGGASPDSPTGSYQDVTILQ